MTRARRILFNLTTKKQFLDIKEILRAEPGHEFSMIAHTGDGWQIYSEWTFQKRYTKLSKSFDGQARNFIAVNKDHGTKEDCRACFEEDHQTVYTVGVRNRLKKRRPSVDLHENVKRLARLRSKSELYDIFVTNGTMTEYQFNFAYWCGSNGK